MQKPSALLAEIVALADGLAADDSFNPQQQTFLRHIHNTAQELQELAQDIPPTEYGIRVIVPTLGEAFSKPQAVLFGYAKMLLEQPEAFGGKSLNAEQQQRITLIYDKGIELARLTDELQQAAIDERKAQHNAAPVIFDLNMLIWQNIPVYRYWLRNKAVKVTAEFPQGLPPVLCNPYHITAIAQHIVLTMATELIEYGHIRISGALREDSQAVVLNFFCTGLKLTEAEQNILFKQQGRYVYQERIQAQNATLHFSHEAGLGATVHLALPIPSRATG